jgi:YHS domain-containing protein
MLLRYVLVLLLIIFVARAFWRVVDGVLEGLGGRPAARRTPRRVAMARDPICGTFVVPDHALVVTDGSERVYFCSAACRDKYRAGRASRAAEGRSA